jgi:nucleoside phosphorylase
MRPIAIMGAMQEELAGLRPHIQGAQTVTVGSREVTSGTWHGHSVVLVLSRIGKVAAATTATALIERFNVKQIVFTGVAGGLSPQVGVGDMLEQTRQCIRNIEKSLIAAGASLADIVSTTTSPSERNLLQLALVAVIRTFLNVFLAREIESEQRLEAERAATARLPL